MQYLAATAFPPQRAQQITAPRKPGTSSGRDAEGSAIFGHFFAFSSSFPLARARSAASARMVSGSLLNISLHPEQQT